MAGREEVGECLLSGVFPKLGSIVRPHGRNPFTILNDETVVTLSWCYTELGQGRAVLCPFLGVTPS